ncbi:MAG: sterol desaturase family protein [Hyphomicrobiales bacterium]|nr:sterol desaturase family protein [Hyphomicrobiales bacterium]MBV8768332.1 sterol desaturase family protein [Hyphomicrobiales bacterium]MBV9053366.1 sterol desaturase family protein [Hyphomicrobiales bacterium]
MQAVFALWDRMEDALASGLLTPFFTSLGIVKYMGDPAEMAQFFMVNAIQIAIIGFLFRPLETILPQERWASRKLTRIDLFYTLLKEFGLVPLFTFALLLPASNWLGDKLGLSGGDTTLIEDWIPWFKDKPLLLFVLYFAIFDLTQYVIHRLQHAVPWWWALHSLHHSQRQVSCWTDDRNHMLDDVLEAVIVGSVGLIIGVPAGQYALLILMGRLIENFSHANVRVRFGPVIDKVLVDPLFHRLHHMRADPHDAVNYNCNFALVLPLWDILFRTALYGEAPRPCGVDDPDIDADNERSWLGQQIAGFQRFFRALRSSFLREPPRSLSPDAAGRSE